MRLDPCRDSTGWDGAILKDEAGRSSLLIAVECHSLPSGSGYLRTQRFGKGWAVISTELPDLRMEPAEILIG